MDYTFDDKIPIYLQIINYLKKDLIMGKLKPGDKLPSVREMSALIKVNPNTVARVYQEIEREGLTYTQRGMGTFIKEDSGMIEKIRKEMAQETVGNFIEGMKRLGFNQSEVIKVVEENWNTEKGKERSNS